LCDFCTFGPFIASFERLLRKKNRDSVRISFFLIRSTVTPTPSATPTPLLDQLSASPAKLNFGNAIYGGLDFQGQIVTKFTRITNMSKTSSVLIDASAGGDLTVVGGDEKACTG